MKPNQPAGDVRWDESYPTSTCSKLILTAHTGSVTGRQCEGYQMEARHVASADEAQDSAGYHMNADLELYRPSAVPNQSRTEARYLQYFSEKTVAQLTYFFPDDLWNVTILQIAQSHPSVRHALSSLSWYHERFVRPTTDLGNEASFALVQYNLAIKHVLVEQQPSQPVHVGIISCLLFVCIEVCHMRVFAATAMSMLTECQSLRGNLTTAMHLYKYGRQIIQVARRSLIGGASRWDAYGSEEFLCAMEAIFLPLGIQMSLVSTTDSILYISLN